MKEAIHSLMSVCAHSAKERVDLRPDRYQRMFVKHIVLFETMLINQITER